MKIKKMFLGGLCGFLISSFTSFAFAGHWASAEGKTPQEAVKEAVHALRMAVDIMDPGLAGPPHVTVEKIREGKYKATATLTSTRDTRPKK